ncbi:MAG: metal ABC transporter permease [Christensenellales bacterium]|jgi:manganese/zinc/iron transport system permease protein
MQDIIALFSDFTFQTVALGSLLLGVISGVLGCFAVLRKQSLLGDGISHSALPGVVLAFLITGNKNTEVLLLGALCSGLLATLLILAIVRHSRIQFDGALALILSVFFGAGLVLLTLAQKIPNSNQAGLNRFLFGQASALLPGDLTMMAICGGILLALVALFWKEFKLFSFDAGFAQSLGFSTRRLNLLLSSLVVMAILIGLQTVGVILMSAMLVAPAVAARQWTRQLWQMVLLSAVFGGSCGVAGVAISSLAIDFPTGPTIVVCVSLIVLLSMLLAPGRGMLAKLYQRRKNRWQMKKQQLKAEGEDSHVPTT